MSIASKIHKQRLLRRGRMNKKRRHRLPRRYYHNLKIFVGTAEFASLVANYGSVEAALLSSVWYEDVSRHPNFQASRQCEIWVRRMTKSWRAQQVKRAKRELLAAKTPSSFRQLTAKSGPQMKKERPRKEKLHPLQALRQNDEVYVVCSESLSPAIAHQHLLMRYDAASGREREDLARRIQATQALIRAKVFVGKIRNNRFAGQAGRFDWQTDFRGAIFEVQFQADGFKSAWKARTASTGNCNTVKGWHRHYIHRRSRMPARFSSLVWTKLKESGKTHLIRDLGLARLAA